MRERLFVLGNLSFSVSRAALVEELEKIDVRCERVVTVECPGSYDNRPLNNGNALLFLKWDDAHSADELMTLDRTEFCGRCVSVTAVKSLSVCVKNAPEGVGDQYIADLFENSAVADVRCVSMPDRMARVKQLWFVDFRGPQDFARAITDHLRDKVKALPAPPLRRDALQKQTKLDEKGDGMDAANAGMLDDGVVNGYYNGRDGYVGAGPSLSKPHNGGDLRHALSSRGTANRGAGPRLDKNGSSLLRDLPPAREHSFDDAQGREPSTGFPSQNSRVSPPPPPPRRGEPEPGPENQAECPPGARGRVRTPLGLFRDSRDAARWELVRESISTFLERDFDSALALHVRHLKFCELSDRGARELALKRCVEDEMGGVRVKSVTILGRKGTSAVVMLYDESSMQAVPADGMGFKFEDWPVEIGRFKRRMRFAMKGFRGDAEKFRRCEMMCGPSTSTFEFASEVRGDSVIVVEGDGHGAVTLMAMDGLNGIACNVVADSSFGPDRSANGRGFDGRDVPERGPLAYDRQGREFGEREYPERVLSEHSGRERDMPSGDSHEFPHGPRDLEFSGRSPLHRPGRDLSARRGADRDLDSSGLRPTNGGDWKVFIENAPFGSGTVLHYVKGQIGTRVWLDIQPGPKSGTFYLSGKRAEDLERVLRLSGIPVQDPKFRGEAIVVTDVGNERRYHRTGSPSGHEHYDTKSPAHRFDSRDFERDRRYSLGSGSPRGDMYRPDHDLPRHHIDSAQNQTHRDDGSDGCAGAGLDRLPPRVTDERQFSTNSVLSTRDEQYPQSSSFSRAVGTKRPRSDDPLYQIPTLPSKTKPRREATDDVEFKSAQLESAKVSCPRVALVDRDEYAVSGAGDDRRPLHQGSRAQPKPADEGLASIQSGVLGSSASSSWKIVLRQGQNLRMEPCPDGSMVIEGNGIVRYEMLAVKRH
jgi:hypothetical protein